MAERKGLSRRGFLGGALATGLIGAASLAGCSNNQKDESTSYLPESWDAEADIVIVGFGAAGAAAAITANHENLGSIIVLEAAPEAMAGGNSRVCGQNMLIPTDVEGIITYQKSLNAGYSLSNDPETEDAMYEAWATELSKNKEWFESFGVRVTETTMNSREFPEVEGSEAAQCYLVDDTVGNSAVWNALKEEIDYLGIEVQYDTRAIRVVKNPLKNEALGIEATQDDKTLYYKAKKGVILSCGGFENDPDLQKVYMPVGSSWSGLLGTEYNRGDGFKMVAPFGAKMRSMTNYTGPTWAHRVSGEDSPYTAVLGFASKDFIYVGPDNKRFMNEEYEGTARHTMLRLNGVWQHPAFNTPSHVIFGKKAFESLPCTKIPMGMANIDNLYVADDATGLLEAGVIKCADTVEELAEILGRNPDDLASTVNTYNEYCKNGTDLDFHRGEPMELNMASVNAGGASEDAEEEANLSAMEGFELEAIESPFYALEMVPTMGNTQGGPVRGVNGEVIDMYDNAVPRLYTAGEFGTIYSSMYNGGGNLSEAISSGRIAVRSIAALDAWDAEEEQK